MQTQIATRELRLAVHDTTLHYTTLSKSRRVEEKSEKKPTVAREGATHLGIVAVAGGVWLFFLALSFRSAAFFRAQQPS